MKLFHGSKRILENPVAGGSNPHNDYGAAFYVTSNLDSAKEWACRNDSTGYVNSYELDLNGLSVLDLTDQKQYSVLHWVALLLKNRELEPSFLRSFASRVAFLEEKYSIKVQQYDLIKGFRADDAYFRFPLDFVRGNLTLEQLEHAFSLGDLGIQYALLSEMAIKNLRFLGFEEASRDYIGRYYGNIEAATKIYDSLNRDEDGVRIMDLMREHR